MKVRRSPSCRDHRRPPAGAIVRAVLALALIGSAPSLAAQTAVVRGTVRSARTDAPLAGVRVSAVGTTLRTTSDADGRYRLSALPQGIHTLRFELLGHQVHSATVDLRRDLERVLDVALEPRAVELRPVTVIEERTQLVGAAPTPGAAHELTREDLDATVSAFGDVHAVLRQVPGVNIQQEDGYGLRPNIGMRGAGSQRSSKITLMEDGILIAPAPYAAPAAYYFPAVGRMDGVEVRKGSSQIKYGPRTIGGALNLLSARIPEDLLATAEVTAGQDATRRVRAEVGDAYQNVGWLLQTYQVTTDGFKQLDTGGPTGFDVEDYLMKLRVNTNPTARIYQELELKVGLNNHRSDETYLGLTEADFRAAPLRRYAASQRDVMTIEHRQLSARYFMQPRPGVDFTATAYRNDFARSWYKLQSVAGKGLPSVLDNPDRYPAELAILRGGDSGPSDLTVRDNNRDYYSQGVQAVTGLQFRTGGVRHDAEVGVRYHADQEDRFQRDDRYQMLNGTMVLTAAGAPGSQANQLSDARAVALFVQHTLRIGRLTAAPGLRYETIDFTRTDYASTDPQRTAPRVRENSVSAFIPGVGLHYAAAEGIGVIGGVHKGFDPPGPGAAPETKVEESLNYEAGFRVKQGGLALQAVGFFSDYRNVLGRATLAVGETGTGDEFNGGAVDVLGLEVGAAYDVLAGRSATLALPLTANYTFTRATFQTSFASDFEPWGTVQAGDHLPYVPTHQFYARAELRHPRWSATVAANAVSAMRTVAGQGPIVPNEATDAYVVLNAEVQYRVAPWATVLLAVENVTDEHYVVARRPAGARPGLPRTLFGGLRLHRLP